jgi:hypothetical protein
MSAVAGIENAQSPAMKRRESLRWEIVDPIPEALHKIDVRWTACGLGVTCYQDAEESSEQDGIAHGALLLS